MISIFRGKTLLLILFMALLFRVFFILFFVDLNNANYFEYGDIITNLLAGKGYSLAYQIDNFGRTYPSAYMPPGYVAFLLPFMLITDIFTRNILILSSQIVLSIIVIFLVYKFTRIHFSESSALIAAAFSSFLPEFIFASNSYGPTILYHLGCISLLFILYDVEKEKRIRKYLFVGLLVALLIYLRSEFILFGIFILIIYAIERQIKPFFIVIGVILIIIAPWQVRNYLTFEKFAPISTSGGLNFYRGHNPYSIGDWGDEQLISELKKNIGRNDYELHMSRIYFERGIETIKEQPVKEITNSFIKIFHLWIINPTDSRTGMVLYLIPWAFLLFSSILGLIVSFSWKKHKFIYLFLIYSTLIAVIFFALPRYQTMMKVILIPFAAYGLEWFFKRLQNKNNKLIKFVQRFKPLKQYD